MVTCLLIRRSASRVVARAAGLPPAFLLEFAHKGEVVEVRGGIALVVAHVGNVVQVAVKAVGIAILADSRRVLVKPLGSKVRGSFGDVVVTSVGFFLVLLNQTTQVLVGLRRLCLDLDFNTLRLT